VGPFNAWDGRRHVLRRRGTAGLWEIFIPDLGEGETYQYELIGPDGALLPLKADPFGFGAAPPPETASVVRALDGHDWADADWLARRGAAAAPDAPISIYEVHLASWKRVAGEDDRPLTYTELARDLVPYVRDMGFTHLELLPIAEHPFAGSWGYQPVGLFAPSSRHGTLAEFRMLVEACHAVGLGLILDWVPAHFPSDPHGLARFDGTPLYEYADPREGLHREWNTMIPNFGRPEVASYLTASGLYWLTEHHVDGLRVDAVASMLYRDYARAEGEWVPNAEGGRENHEAMAFLRRTNAAAREVAPGAVTMAEESTAFPGVTKPEATGGLGFDMKWNMGWAHDTLRYMTMPPEERRHHHGLVTFGLHYAFDEAFVLSLSHDEVARGKGSLLGRMPGDEAARFAALRAYLAFMWGHPGKKLLFMGCEFGQARDWDHDVSLDWDLLDDPRHRGVQRLVRDLNAALRAMPALHQRDAAPEGFAWVEGGAEEEQLFAWIRRGAEGTPDALVVVNMSATAREGRRIGVPAPGYWAERVNTDATEYGGGGMGNYGGQTADAAGHAGWPHALTLTVPPLATLVFEHAPRD
jgi:1,4-alpha-glucan branching enzyme